MLLNTFFLTKLHVIFVDNHQIVCKLPLKPFRIVSNFHNLKIRYTYRKLASAKPHPVQFTIYIHTYINILNTNIYTQNILHIL